MTLMSEQGFGLSRAGLEQLCHHRTVQIKAAIKVRSVTLQSLVWGNQCTPWLLQGPCHMPLFKQKIPFLSSHNLKLNVFDSGAVIQIKTNIVQYCNLVSSFVTTLMWMSSVQQLELLLTGPQGRNLPALSPWDVQSHSGWKAAASLRSKREIQRTDVGFVSQTWGTLETILSQLPIYNMERTLLYIMQGLWRYISLLPSGRPHDLYCKSIRAIQNVMSDCAVCKQGQPWDIWICFWKDSVPKSQIYSLQDTRNDYQNNLLGHNLIAPAIASCYFRRSATTKRRAMSACKSCAGAWTPQSVQTARMCAEMRGLMPKNRQHHLICSQTEVCI